VIVDEVERLRWRIWNGKTKNAKRSIDRVRKVMHAYEVNSANTGGARLRAGCGVRCLTSTAISESDSNRLCNAMTLILLEKAPTSIDQPLPDSATSA
jgi:hypothetical protein